MPGAAHGRILTDLQRRAAVHDKEPPVDTHPAARPPPQRARRHGEVDAIRRACKAVGSPHLRGCVIYTSAQPCPMCHTACLWARLEAIYYGAKYEDVKKYGRFEDEVGRHGGRGGGVSAELPPG